MSRLVRWGRCPPVPLKLAQQTGSVRTPAGLPCAPALPSPLIRPSLSWLRGGGHVPDLVLPWEQNAGLTLMSLVG